MKPSERVLRKIAWIVNRRGWTDMRLEVIPRAGFYGQDALWTIHAHHFEGSPDFERAYARAVRAGGFDYGIRWRAHAILWAATTAAPLDGAFVECGTGRGFMASAICEYLGWGSRRFYLFDTFNPATPTADGKQDGPISPYYADGPEAVAVNFAEWPGVELVQGEIPATLTRRAIDTIAFLHVDMNHAIAEEAAVRYFWPRLVRGGFMVFDDYGLEGYEAQRDAVDALSQELGFSVFACPTGQGIVVKQ